MALDNEVASTELERGSVEATCTSTSRLVESWYPNVFQNHNDGYTVESEPFCAAYLASGSRS